MAYTSKLTQNIRASGSFFVMNFLLLIAVYSLHSESSSIVLIGIIILNLQTWAWFSIMHSCGHNAYFTNKIMNTIVGHIASIFVLVPFYTWKNFHNEHHLWTGYLGKDPTASDINIPKDDKSIRFVNFFWKLWIPILSLSHSISHLWNYKAYLKLSKNSNKKDKEKALSEFLTSVLVLAGAHILLLIVFGLKIYSFYLCSFILFLLTSDIVLTSQHAILPMKTYKDGDRPLHTGQHHHYTRSITFGKIIDHYILLNFNEHNIHHKYPSIPHFDLPKIKRSDEKENRINGFHWMFKIRKMHVSSIINSIREEENG